MEISAYDQNLKLLRENELNGDISTDLLCSICKKLLIGACNGPCGCRYCTECISTYLAGEDKACPGDLKDCQETKINFCDHIQIDRAINIRISRIVVKCNLGSCQFKDELRKMEDHARVCQERSVNCPYWNVGCNANAVVYSHMKDHLETEIYLHSKLLLECIDNWKNDIEGVKKSISESQIGSNGDRRNHGVINSLPASEQREIELLRNEITELRTEIKNTINFSENRLSNENQKEAPQTQSHEKLESKELVLLKQTILEMSNDNKIMKNEIVLLNNEMVYLKNENRVMKENLKAVMQENEMQQKQITNSMTKADGEYDLLHQLEERWHHTIKTLASTVTKQNEFSDRIEKIERKNVSQALGISQSFPRFGISNRLSLELEQFPVEIRKTAENPDPFEFTWNVENFSDVCRKAQANTIKSIFSDTFYTHRNGYRMTLQMYPKGAFDGKDTHLSLFFCITEGPFDCILQWPFKHDVTLSLINQRIGRPQFMATIKNENFPNHERWNKPTSDKNGPFGFMKFYPLSGLLHDNELIRDDKIIVKCKITFVPSTRKSEYSVEFD